jgi:hypothetical protein
VHRRAFGTVTVAGSLLGDDNVGVAVLAVGVGVLDAVITALTAVTLALKLDAFSRHFFLLPRLPCPGPGMLSVGTERKLRYWCWVLCYWCTGVLLD